MGVFYKMRVNNTGFGLDFGHSFDLGMNYKLPYYSEREYLVVGADASVHAEAFTYVKFLTPLINTKFKLELNGMKLVPQARLLYDITNYSDLCYSLFVYTRGLEVVLTSELEVLDCEAGLLATGYSLLFNWALNSTVELGTPGLDCEFKQFHFEQTPLWRVGFDAYNWWESQVIPEQCLVKKLQPWEKEQEEEATE